MAMMCLSQKKLQMKAARKRANTTTKNPQVAVDKIAISMLVLSRFISILVFICTNQRFERHCVGGEGKSSCGIQTRDYNVPLRIGTLFVILATSAIGVFAPILLMKLPFASINGVVATVIKQFGTGIIISTAFVHVSEVKFDAIIKVIYS